MSWCNIIISNILHILASFTHKSPLCDFKIFFIHISIKKIYLFFNNNSKDIQYIFIGIFHKIKHCNIITYTNWMIYMIAYLWAKFRNIMIYIYLSVDKKKKTKRKRDLYKNFHIVWGKRNNNKNNQCWSKRKEKYTRKETWYMRTET